MINGQPASLRWVHVPPEVPCIAISEAGDSIMLTCLFGVMSYSRAEDSEAFASHLEQVASTVRDLAKPVELPSDVHVFE